MASQAKIIIVTGAPCAGKTTVAERLAQALAVPLFAKDDIKERLFDAIGWGGRAESRQVDAAAYAVLFHLAEREASVGRAFALESNFKPAEHSAPLRRLAKRFGADVLQVVCHCAFETLAERFRQRAARKERHPGHCDAALVRELPDMLARGGYGPLQIGGTRLDVDTTDLAAADDAALLRQARHFAERQPAPCPEGRGRPIIEEDAEDLG